MGERIEIGDLYPGKIIRLNAGNVGIKITVKLEDGSSFSANLVPGAEMTYTVGTSSAEVTLSELDVPLGVRGSMDVE